MPYAVSPHHVPLFSIPYVVQGFFLLLAVLIFFVLWARKKGYGKKTVQTTCYGKGDRTLCCLIILFNRPATACNESFAC